MPQVTSAIYNLGKPRQSSRYNSFNKRNSGEFENQQNIIKERLRLLNEAKLLKQKQIANRPKLAVLFNPNTYPQDALMFMEFIKDDTVASKFTIIYYTDLLKTLEEQYNLGFRFFASPTIGSFSLYTYCIPFCKKYPDVLLITSYSTQYFENGILPFNIIRTSINDKDMMSYIVTELLYNLNTLTKKAVPLYYRSISNNNYDTPIFKKIVYIYTEKDANGNLDTYSEGYGEQLKNEVNLQNGAITIELFKISDDNFILPQEVKTLLSENPVSGVNFISSDKTMFILNSYNPEKILQLFNEEYMYDNYFIFGDVFPSNHYTSKYKFNYAICPVGNFSFEGYKTSGFLPGGYYFSPFLYSIVDIILKLLPYYSQVYYKNITLSSIEFNMLFIYVMKLLKLIVDNNYWYERKIFTYYIDTKEDDLTNAQYNYYIFFQFKFNPFISGSFIKESEILIPINEDVNDSTSISLLNFKWNSRSSVDDNFLSNTPINLVFNSFNTILEWKKNLNKSVGGSRFDENLEGNNNHTPLFFEFWRSHDERFKNMTIDISYNLIMDYNIPKVYNINERIIIKRECYQDAGINNSILENNFLYEEEDEIYINFETGEITESQVANYIVLQYFKGTRYKKSFSGLTIDYLAPIIINIKINPIIIYKKYKINDYVLSNDIIGKVIDVSDDYQEITIQPYINILEEENDSHYIKIDTASQPFISNQLDTKLYSKISPVKLIDYTDWSIFKKNMFIRSIFMNDIINNDSTQNNVISYENFGGDSRPTILQPVKDNISLTFSTYDYWLKWKNLVNSSINDLHTEIFWEMYRSNKLIFIEKNIDVDLIMDNNETKIYEINEIAEIERKIYSDLNTYESSETILLPISFKTSDINPNDIINKPIIYLEYFVGDEYKKSLNGILETYFTPILIHVNIIPNIIYTKYKINDYIVYQNKFIAQVLSVSDNYTIIEIELYNIIFTDNDTIYVKSKNSIYNVNQNEISLFATIGSLITELSNEKFTLTESMKNIKNINDVETLDKCNYIDSEIIDIVILEDLYNIYGNYFNFFRAYYINEIVELINNYFIIFSSIDVFNNWKNKINDEILKNSHTYLFFELWRSHNNLLMPIQINIDHKLVMNTFNSDKYNIVKTINLSRNIFDSNLSIISNENFTFDLNFYTEKILPSDVLNKPIIYVGYFKGNKYLNYNGIPNYYSPVIITINILPVNISEKIKINEFVVYNKNIYKIINIENNFENIDLQKYLIVKTQFNTIYIKKTTMIETTDSNNIIPYSDLYEMKLVDQSEWGVFDVNNIIEDNKIETDIILRDSSSVGNKSLDDFNLSNVFLFEEINIITQNENTYNNFKKSINRSVTFDKLNHTPLFFEIWRSHNNLLIPLTIEINYNLQMSLTPSIYLIEKNISFIRNIYDIIGVKEDNLKFKENDSLNISIKTAEITSNDILNNPLIFVKYFKGHKYITSFNNVNDVYFSPIIVKINIIPHEKNNLFELNFN